MEVFSLHVCLHTTYMPGGCGGWKRVTSPATRVIDGYKPREVLGVERRVSGRAASALNR